MKRTLFFVGIFLLFQTYSYSNVLLRKLDKTNSILKSSDVGNMYIDKSNRIWINLAQQLVCYDKQLDKWTDFSQIILENMKYEYNDGVKASNTKVWHYTEDEKGNLIFHTVAGVAVYYSESSKWEFFVYYNPKLPSYFQTFAALSIFYSEQTKRIYLTDLGDSVFYGQYDDIKRKYEFKPEYKILLDMMPYFYDICQLNDGKLIYLGDQDFYMIDPITNKYTKLKYNNSVKEFLASDYDFYYSYRNLKLVNEDNRIIYLQSIIKKNDEDYRYVPYIMDIQIVNDSVINPRKLELPSIYSGEKKSSWFFLTDWVDKDNLKDSLIIGCKKDLFIYNVKNRILSIIPRPEEFKSDTLEYWNHRAGMIDIQKRELWLASPFHGIMIYDLDELIKTSYPVNIEELETLLTIVGIDNIFPIPANETIKIEYFQQIGSEDEIKLEIYNLKGEILPNIDYHISTIEGMRKLITITTNIKEPGTYIANIKLRNYSASDKFIITR